MGYLVCLKVTRLGKRFGTVGAVKRLNSRMDSLVSLQVIRPLKRFFTVGTLEGNPFLTTNLCLLW